MPVPEYQSLMALALRALGDGGDHSLAELRVVVGKQLALTEDDLSAQIPSGTSLLASRLHWASLTCIKRVWSVVPNAGWSVSRIADGKWRWTT
jgi:restriction endonuclease Mrr